MIVVCPACGSTDLKPFYQVDQAPVHSVVLLASQVDALRYPRGEIRLAFCRQCGFVANLAYDPSLQDYSSGYESTQGYSPTFNRFAEELADHLIEKYNLPGKEIIEIGCGQGEFLSLLCEESGSRGVGFDPAYDPARQVTALSPNVTIIKDYYSEQYTHQQADLIVCKMTLEHIQPVSEFIATVRRAAADKPGAVIFFQVPNLPRLLEETAFWDIYYEHCSYFSPGSLARLFRANDFTVQDLWTGYDDQYLMIEVRVGKSTVIHPLEETPAQLEIEIDTFTRRVEAIRARWMETICAAHRAGDKVVLWGSGSKAVAFLTTLGIGDEIEYCVDINPHKHGTFMAGSGQAVIAPRFLAQYQPDMVIAMNPVYQAEIQADLTRMGLSPRLLALGR
jgi:2-polyprenyl-3-methyl-5-hydroxy-6-metoxy-1,4-benzoquinol methylase